MQTIYVWAGQSQVSSTQHWITACISRNLTAALATPHHVLYWHVSLKVSHILFSRIISL